MSIPASFKPKPNPPSTANGSAGGGGGESVKKPASIPPTLPPIPKEAQAKAMNGNARSMATTAKPPPPSSALGSHSATAPAASGAAAQSPAATASVNALKTDPTVQTMAVEDAISASLNAARASEAKEKLEAKDEQKAHSVPTTLVSMVEDKADYVMNHLWNIADPNDPATNSFGIIVVKGESAKGFPYSRLMCYWMNGRPKNACRLTRPVAENMRERIRASACLPPLQPLNARCGAAGNLIVEGDVKSKMYTKDIHDASQFIQFDGLAEHPSHADPADAGGVNLDGTPKAPRDKAFLALLPVHNERHMMWVISHVMQDKTGTMGGETKVAIDKYMKEPAMRERIEKHLAAVRAKAAAYAKDRQELPPTASLPEKYQRAVQDLEHSFGFKDDLLLKEAAARAVYERMMDAEKVTIGIANQKEKETKKVIEKTEMLRLFNRLTFRPKKELKMKTYSGSKRRRGGNKWQRKGAQKANGDQEEEDDPEARLKALLSYKKAPAAPAAAATTAKDTKHTDVGKDSSASASTSLKKIDVSAPGQAPAVDPKTVIAPYQPAPLEASAPGLVPLKGVTMEDAFKTLALNEGLGVKRVKVFEAFVVRTKDGRVETKERPIPVDQIDKHLTGDSKVVATYCPSFYINGDKKGAVGAAHQLAAVTIVRAVSANKRPKMVAATGLIDEAEPGQHYEGMDEYEEVDQTNGNAIGPKYDRPLASEAAGAASSSSATAAAAVTDETEQKDATKHRKANDGSDVAAVAAADSSDVSASVVSMDGVTANELAMEGSLTTAEKLVESTDVSKY